MAHIPIQCSGDDLLASAGLEEDDIHTGAGRASGVSGIKWGLQEGLQMCLIELTDLSSLEVITRAHHSHI